MLFLTNLYQVSWGVNDKLTLDGEEINVTPVILRQAKIITKIHSIMIGVGTVVGYLISTQLNNNSFIGLILIIAAMLTINTVIFNLLSKKLIRKRLK